MKNIQPYSWWLLPCLLTPFQQNKFMLLLRQRFDIDLLLRLSGIDITNDLS